jgi:hypothetical protein
VDRVTQAPLVLMFHRSFHIFMLVEVVVEVPVVLARLDQ